MNKIFSGQELRPFTIIGYNYGTDHDNKIHSDEVAAQFGFKGGLVPGVAVYAYLVHVVADFFGVDWVRSGAMTAKFLKPIYDGEEAVIKAVVSSVVPLSLKLELFNPTMDLCAVGEASLPGTIPDLQVENYPLHVLPSAEARVPAGIENLPIGKILGSLHWNVNLAEIENKFLPEVRAKLPLFFGEAAVCHPAFYLAQANQILMENVKLGPWIHTSSKVQHYSLPVDGEQLAMRGKVVESLTKRGHEVVVMELGIFAEDQRIIASIRHSAIVRLSS